MDTPFQGEIRTLLAVQQGQGWLEALAGRSCPVSRNGLESHLKKQSSHILAKQQCCAGEPLPRPNHLDSPNSKQVGLYLVRCGGSEPHRLMLPSSLDSVPFLGVCTDLLPCLSCRHTCWGSRDGVCKTPGSLCLPEQLLCQDDAQFCVFHPRL